MVGNMGKAMKQVQKMQAEMLRVQQQLGEKQVTSSVGGGVVTVVVDGHRRIKSIQVKPEVVDPDDIETLEDLLLLAVNDGLQQAEDLAAEEMKKVTGGMQLPPGLF